MNPDHLLFENSSLRLWYVLTRQPRKSGSIHVINQDRGDHGEFHHLFQELQEDPAKFFAYFRMSVATFEYLLDKIQHKLIKRWTNFNLNPIMPAERLAVTLRLVPTNKHNLK